MATIDHDRTSSITIDSSTLDQLRSNVLESQITTYRYLARNMPVSDSLLSSCSYKLRLANLIQNHIQQENKTANCIILTEAPAPDGDAQTNTDASLMFSSASNMYQWLIGSNDAKDENSFRPIQKHPIHANPLFVQAEQDKRIHNRMLTRMQELETMPATMNPELRTQALIEFKSLKLLQFQKQIRNEVLNSMKKDTFIQTALNPRAYKRPKRHQLREARSTEYYERQCKLEIKQRKYAKHKKFLNNILTHAREFREYHRQCAMATVRMCKSVQTHFANTQRDLIKKQKRDDKIRLLTLMNEDEEAYRKLVDETKDTRLKLLLSQTDAYIDTLKQLVRRHQQASRTQTKSDHPQDSTSISHDLSSIDEEPKATPSDVERTTNETAKSININEDDEYDAKESYYSIAHRIVESIPQQSELLVGGQLKPYQLHGLEWLVSLYNNNLNGILADEMGLGKTIQTIALIVHLIDHKNDPGPSLIIVPLSTLSNWAAEFQRWAPSVTVLQYKGLPHVRKMLGQTIRTSGFNVLLTTYEYIMRDRTILSKVSWKYLIIDEGHRMKNHHCKLTQILNKYYSNAPHRLLLTGTPLQNNLPELWALLNFILPTIFKCSTTFTDWFNVPFATLPSEKVELNHEETLLIIRRLHQVLRPFLLRRLKKEVEAQLPEKVEYIIKCELSALQRCLYHAMAKNRTLIIANQSGKSGRRALMNKIVQLRKICNHPFLFHEIEERLAQSLGYSDGTINGPDLFRASGKFELLDRILPKLKASGHKVLLFCQMTTVMDLLEYYFAYRNYTFIRLDGTTKADDRSELLKTFNDSKTNYFIFLLSTRAGGIGLNLQRADTVILFDSDWNPHQDQQAQDRAHRIGQKNEVRVLRLITVNTIEEKILACAKHKLNVDEKVIQAGKFNRSSTSSERQDYLEQLIEGEDESKDDDEDIPDDEILNQMIARTEVEFNLFNRMDVARREYESCYGVGNGGDGANERRELKIINTTRNTKCLMRSKREKKMIYENTVDQSTETNFSKSSTSSVEQVNNETTREEMLATSEETTSLLLEELEDEEDVDYAHEQPKVHRRVKINRLMTEDELPDWLRSNADHVEETLEIDEALGRGRRQHKDIDYNDNLTEREFLEALEEGNLDETIEQKRLQKLHRRNTSSTQDNDIDVDETETRLSFDTSITSNLYQQNTTSKRISKKKHQETIDSIVISQCQLLLENLLAYRTDDKRQLAHVFIRLPGPKQLPLYYRVIKEPIDFQHIRNKIDSYRYSSLEEFDADIKLLVNNAKTFNCENSVIYSDSCLLEKVYQNLRNQLKSGLLQRSTEFSSTVDVSLAASSSLTRGRSAHTTKSAVVSTRTSDIKVSRRGRKRKATVLRDNDLYGEEHVIFEDGDNHEI